MKYSVKQQIDEFDADEWHDDSAYAVDQRVLEEQSHGACRFEGYAAHGERNQKRNDYRVEDESGQDGAFKTQMQNVKAAQLLGGRLRK